MSSLQRRVSSEQRHTYAASNQRNGRSDLGFNLEIHIERTSCSYSHRLFCHGAQQRQRGFGVGAMPAMKLLP
jgi:hypothetical protein